jgi:hypothetical protein
LIEMTALDKADLPARKAEAPKARFLCYRNTMLVQSYSTSRDGNSGVLYPPDDAWVLKDASGKKMSSGPYPTAFLMDVGNPNYQQAFADNCAKWTKEDGFHGVFLDDFCADLTYHLAGRPYPPKYPNRDAWCKAMESFMVAVMPVLHVQRLVAYANTNIQWNQADLWTSWAKWLDGLMLEGFLRWGQQTGQRAFVNPDWSIHIDALRRVEAAGKAFVGLTYGGTSAQDAEAMRYIRASFLLFHDPGSLSVSIWQNDDRDPFDEAWAFALGRPLAGATKSGFSWKRPFERGTIRVDTSSGSARVGLN